MNRLSTGILIAASLIPLPRSEGTRDYYLSANGDDRNPGSREQPWRSIEKVNAMRFGPGDSLLFHAGDTFAGNLVLDQRSHTSSHRPIMISSYGPSRATIAAGGGTAILVKNLGGIVIRDLVVLGSGASWNQGSGIDIRNDGAVSPRLEFVRVESVEASGFRWAGIYVGGPTGPSVSSGHVAQSGFRNVQITNCAAHHNLYYGIHVGGPFDMHASTYSNEGVTVSNSVAYSNTGDPLYTKNHSGSGILVENTDDGTIERCVAYENGGNNGSHTGGPVGIWAHNANRIVIQSSTSYRNRTKGLADGGGFDFDGGVSNSTMQYNLSFDNDGPGYLVWNYAYAPRLLQHIVIRYNISSGDARRHVYGGIHIGSTGPALRDVEVYHNTVVTRPDREVRAAWVGGPSHERIRFWNNLMVTTGRALLVEADASQNDVMFQGNAYWARTGPFAVLDHGKMFSALDQWRTSGQEMWAGTACGRYGDPGLVDDLATPISAPSPGPAGWYRLRPNSPLIDRGMDIDGLFGVFTGLRDIRGTTVPMGSARDIGAQEYEENRNAKSYRTPQGSVVPSGR